MGGLISYDLPTSCLHYIGAAFALREMHFTQSFRINLLSRAGVGNCFGLRAASRSRKLAEGRTF